MDAQFSRGLTEKIDEIRKLIETRRVGLFDVWAKMHALEESQEWRESGLATFRQFALSAFGLRSTQYEYYHAAHQFLSAEQMAAIGRGGVKEFVKFVRCHGDKAHKLAPDLYAKVRTSIEKHRADNGYHPSDGTQKALVKNAAKQLGFPIKNGKPSQTARYNALVEALQQVAQMGTYGTPPERIAEYAEEALREAGHEPRIRYRAKAA